MHYAGLFSSGGKKNKSQVAREGATTNRKGKGKALGSFCGRTPLTRLLVLFGSKRPEHRSLLILPSAR